MKQWVIDFGLNIEEVRERLGEEIPDLPYAQLCDWFTEQLVKEFPKYALMEPTEDARDGETFGVRMVVDSPFRPKMISKYFDLVEVHNYEEIYGSRQDENDTDTRS